MYFPYFRGKQYDLLAIREMLPLIQASNTVPVIEPMNFSEASYRALTAAALQYILIANPEYGDLTEDPTALGALLEFAMQNPNVIVGILISQTTSLAEIESILREYPKRKLALLHKVEFADRRALATLLEGRDVIYSILLNRDVRRSYVSKLGGYPQVLIEDGFNRNGAKRNADFQDRVFFSDLYRTYEQEGFVGFGDYLTVGEPFREGWTPYAVALHVTYQNPEEDDDIWIRHFISDRTDDQSDTPGKFLEAVQKVVAANGDLPDTAALQEFVQLHADQHFPGLGTLKKISMKHHLELVIRSL